MWTMHCHYRMSHRKQGASDWWSIICRWPRTSLLVLIWGVYFSSLFFADINYDDPIYLTSNPLLQSGSFIPRVVAAFQDFNGMWHPLTLLSLAIDGYLFRGAIWAYKMTNLWLHCLNCLLLLSCLRYSGVRLRLAIAASVIMAIHPFAIESVAWISERKGLLGATWLLQPTSGIVAYGPHWWADRNGYLARPLIFLAVSIVVSEVLKARPFRKDLLGVGWLFAAYSLWMLGTTLVSLRTWSDSESFWSNSLAAASGHRIALHNLAVIEADRKNVARAMTSWMTTLEAKYNSVSLRNMAILCYNENHFKRAAVFARAALIEDPSDRSTFLILSDIIVHSPDLVTGMPGIILWAKSAGLNTFAYQPDELNDEVLVRLIQIAAQSGDVPLLTRLFNDDRLVRLIGSNSAARDRIETSLLTYREQIKSPL